MKNIKFNSPSLLAIVLYSILVLILCFIVSEYSYEYGYNMGIKDGGMILLVLLFKLGIVGPF